MTLRIGRWASGKEDEDPGRQKSRRESKPAVREARKQLIQGKRPPGKQDRRPDGERRGRDVKNAAGLPEIAPGEVL
jgi:hypothetical protein